MIEILSLISAGSALIIVLYFLKDRYFSWKSEIEIDIENTFFSIFKSPENTLTDKLGIGFYHLTIVNHSKMPYTIKSLELKYMLKNTRKTADSFVIITGELPNGNPAIIQSNDIDNIVLMNWRNLRSEIGKYSLLDPGTVLSGSAFFIFDCGPSEVNEVHGLELVLVDYRKKRYKQTIKIEENWKTPIRKGFYILNRKFVVKEDSSIHFL